MSIPFLPRNLQNLVEAKQSVTNRLHAFNSSCCGMSFVLPYWLMMKVELKGMKKGQGPKLRLPGRQCDQNFVVGRQLATVKAGCHCRLSRSEKMIKN